MRVSLSRNWGVDSRLMMGCLSFYQSSSACSAFSAQLVKVVGYDIICAATHEFEPEDVWQILWRGFIVYVSVMCLIPPVVVGLQIHSHNSMSVVKLVIGCKSATSILAPVNSSRRTPIHLHNFHIRQACYLAVLWVSYFCSGTRKFEPADVWGILFVAMVF